MIKHNLEGLPILQSPPERKDNLKVPIVRLSDGLTLDDCVFESPILLLGSVGSGKSYLLEQIMKPVLQHAEENDDNVVIFCAKSDSLKFKRQGDPVISVDATDPNSCWSIFREMNASANPELTARDIVKSLTRSQKSKLQPFFTNAANEILYQTIKCMYDDGKKKGKVYTNWELVDFLTKTTVNGDGITWNKLADLRPEYFAHIRDYLGENLDQGFGVISEIRTLIFDCMWGSFASDKSEFSAIESLKTGNHRIFLLYDYANSSEASIKIFKTILNLLLKHSTDEKNGRKTWFFLDEFSLLPATSIIDSMSLGRSAGFRLCACIQSAQLMTRHYKEEEAKALLSLFPNIICLKVQDAFSRKILSDRYGECLCSYSFTSAMQKVVQHAEHRPVVADYDFSLIQNKGDALCSIPAISSAPFLYHGYLKGL